MTTETFAARRVIAAGGVCFVVGALAFVVVFSYLAANFDYPKVLDGKAADVLPRLRAGGAAMRAVWAVYAVLPLLLIPGAVGAYFACPKSRGRMTLAVIFASIGTLAMCLGLMRWPSIHWTLADSYAQAGIDAQTSIAAVFNGLNLYLGNYIGEFLGEICLAILFLLTGLSMLRETRFPKWLGAGGAVFAVLFAVGAFRNVTSAVQPLADVNNFLLPLWMIVLGVMMVLRSGREA
ncbi:MAG: DUF4386 domain-containing protein [Pyrinomonadaceae bacterium]